MLTETRQLPFLTSWAACQRNSGLTIGFVNGCFDLLHPGHRHLLAYTRARCDRLVVAVNSDQSVRDRKGVNRPAQSTIDRLHALYAACRVDADIIFDAPDPSEILAAVQPDLYVMGSDYRDKVIPGAEHCREIVFVDRLPGLSTTELLESRR